MTQYIVLMYGQVIVPTCEGVGTMDIDDDGTKSVPVGTLFTEGLLRSILPLTPEQIWRRDALIVACVSWHEKKGNNE